MGGASSSRIRLIARGLVEAGAQVDVFLMGRNSVESELQGSHQGVHFQYATDALPKAGSIMGRIRAELGLVERARIASELVRRSRAGHLDAIILYTRDFITVWLFSLLARLMRIPSILELCEWPVAHPANNWLRRFQYTLFCRRALSLVDGVLPISRYLEDKVNVFGARYGKSIPVLRVPILVDVTEFQVSEIPPESYVLYCGSWGYPDIIQTVLESFRLVRSRGADCGLVLVGLKESDSRMTGLRQWICELGLEQDVSIPGYVHWPRLKELYANATALLIPLPDTERSKSRFPTKTGEYLASGRPVITTAVGEMNHYLVDGQNAFVVDPDDIEAFAEKIGYIFFYPGEAQKVGMAGRKTAEEQFDYRIHGQRILSFIQQVLDSRSNRRNE